MKPLSLTVGLLLVIFTVYYCNASLVGPNVVVSPSECCFKFFNEPIPKKEIKSIIKTDSKCSTSAFVVTTPRGRYCVSQTVNWAKKAYSDHHPHPPHSSHPPHHPHHHFSDHLSTVTPQNATNQTASVTPTSLSKS